MRIVRWWWRHRKLYGCCRMCELCQTNDAKDVGRIHAGIRTCSTVPYNMPLHVLYCLCGESLQSAALPNGWRVGVSDGLSGVMRHRWGWWQC